jgi:hypothetical protein
VNKSLVDTDTLSGISKAYDQVLLGTAERYVATYGYYTFSSVTVMVTGNTKHFERIQSLGYPLRLKDWGGERLSGA